MKRNMVVILLCILAMMGIVSCNDDRNIVSAYNTVSDNIIITVEDGVGVVSGVVDRNKPIWECIIPESVNGVNVTGIGVGAFSHCRDLTSVTIPDSVKYIEHDAFFWCTSLESVTIGNSVTSIGDWAFFGCTSLTNIEIPDSVTSIEHGSFSSCANLTSIRIPDSVTSIESVAFFGCSGLAEIRIDRPKDSISGAPWGASNATVKWRGEF